MVFNNPEVCPQSWYVVGLSSALRPGQVMASELAGRPVAVYRERNGTVRAIHGLCAHLGANLARGTVVEEGLRCPYHHWTYGPAGRCVRIPVQPEIPSFARVFAYPVREKFGAIWVFNGPEPTFDLPTTRLRDENDVEAVSLPPKVLDLHPHLLTVNGLDTQHYRAVHNFILAAEPQLEEPDPWRIRLTLQVRLTRESWLQKLAVRVAGKVVSVYIETWGGNLCTVEVPVGPLPFMVLFTQRPLKGGRSASQSFLMVPRRFRLMGPIGRVIFNQIMHEDGQVIGGEHFQPHLISADRALATFIRQVNHLPTFNAAST